MYANSKCIIVWVMKSSRIFFRESNEEAFPSCYLRYGACQLDVLNHPKVGLLSLFGRASSRGSPYNHPYVSNGGSWMLIVPSGGLLSRICIRSLLTDELLQLSLSNKGLNLLL